LEFSDRGDKRLDAGIDFRAVLRAEATTDLHFGFGGSDVPFCLIIGEGYIFMESESKHRLLMLGEAVKQVSAFGFLRFAARFFACPALAGCRLRLFFICLLEQILVFSKDFGSFFCRDRCFAFVRAFVQVK